MHQRLDYELGVIAKMGFTGYFLIVWDFIHFAPRSAASRSARAAARAPARSSPTALRITDIDPLKYGLLFERFLNPERVSHAGLRHRLLLRAARRGHRLRHAEVRPGPRRQIITFGTLKAKAVIRDVARVLDLPYDEADAIAKLVPGGPKMTLESALSEEPRLAELANKSDKHRELIETSRKLEGLVPPRLDPRRGHRHRPRAAHALRAALPRPEDRASIATQYTMDYLEECGLVKMDFLGLKTLTLIEKTCDLIREARHRHRHREDPRRRPGTFKLFGEGQHHVGVPVRELGHAGDPAGGPSPTRSRT